MSKFVYDTALEALLIDAAGTTELYLCFGDPTTRAEAITNSLTGTGGSVETPPATTGPDSTGPGSVLTYQAKTGLNIVANGTATVICLCDASQLRLKTDLSTAVGVNDGDTVDLGQFLHSVGDAV